MCLKIPPLPPIKCCEHITYLDASFAHCFPRGKKHEIALIPVFPRLFVTDCSIREDFKNLSYKLSKSELKEIKNNLYNIEKTK